MLRNALCLAIASACAPCALAQSTDVPAPADAVDLDRIEVRGKRSDSLGLERTTDTANRLGVSLLKTPAAVEVVDQETLRERGKQTSVQALEGVTGITASPRPGGAAAMQGRGFAENAFGILYNGIRVGSTNATMRIYDSFAFERVEVLRGAAGLTHGEGSIGGAINYVRKQPSREPQQLELLASAGSNEARRIGLGGGGAMGEIFSGRIDAVYNRFDGDARGNQNEYRHVVASLRADPTSTLTTTLTVDALRSRVDDTYWGTPLVGGRIDARLRDVNYNNLPDNAHDDDVTWLTWKTRWQSGDWTLLNTAWGYRADRDWRDTYRFQYVAATSSVPAQVRRQWFEDLAYDHRYYGNRSEARWAGELGGRALRVSVGLEYARTDFESPRGATAGTSQLVDPFNPPPTSFFTGNPFGRNRTVSVDQIQRALFAEAQLALTDKLDVVGGVRHDRMDFDYRDRRPTSFTAYTREFSPTTGRLGLVFSPQAEASAYVQVASGVESRFTAFFLSPSDIPFDLTRGRQIEAGWKQRFNQGRGEWTAAAYKIDKDRIPFADAATGVTVAVGEQSARGAELALAISLGERIRLETNAAFVRPRYERYAAGGARFDGNVPPNVPRRVANLGLTWEAAPRLQLGGWLRHVGAFYANDANTIELPAATTLDAHARYRVSPSVDLTARVRNATDRLYASWATDQNYVMIAPRRAFEVELQARF